MAPQKEKLVRAVLPTDLSLSLRHHSYFGEMVISSAKKAHKYTTYNTRTPWRTASSLSKKEFAFLTYNLSVNPLIYE